MFFREGHSEHVGFSETGGGLAEEEAIKDSHSPVFPLHSQGASSLGTTGVA